MILNVHNDVSYLTKPKARSRAGGHFFMSQDVLNAKNNSGILNIAKIMKNVMSPVAEAEIEAFL